jgi:hypothetical protein
MKRMGCTERRSRLEEMESASENVKETYHFADLSVGGRTILKHILKE